MKRYRRLTLGGKNIHAAECFAGNFVGVDFGIHQDLTSKFPEDWRSFNKEFIPIYLAKFPDKTKIGAGMACGTLWTVGRGMNIGDIVVCPDGEGYYHFAEITGNYYYQPDGILPHRRPVRWYNQTIARADLHEDVRKTIGVVATIRDISGIGDEIEKFIGGSPANTLVSTDETLEDISTFQMEKHLEEFLVQNWKQTEFGRDYNIFEEEGEVVGQQYQTDTGPIDILAVSKDKKILLVIELKRGRASDGVVGQIQRYMGYVKEELAEKGQTVKGVIIALEDDLRIRRALAVATNIEFYRYQVSFKLVKA